MAEFTAIVGECSTKPFGLSVEDVMAEHKRWRNESWRYESSESFPWKHPVLFQICTELRRAGVERKLGQSELVALAGRQLAKWAKQVEMGYSIPPIRKTKYLKHRPPGESQIADANGAYKKKGMELLAKIRAEAKSKIIK
ncbi:replication protein [Serratia fonticola]|nr:replication protein [Serratia fonticola]NYA35115.1 replication protein [Serratia fonticola]